EDVLKKFGFREKWCKWIRDCLRSSWGSVIVNGSPTEEFQLFKGLKQGMFKGIVLNSSMVLSHMASGLHMNMSKSKIIGITVNGDKVDQVAHRIGCGILEVPFTYLDNFKKVCRWWNVDFVEVSSYDEWLLWISSLRIHGKHKKVLEGVCYGLWWHLWFSRNKWMFGQERPSMERLFDDVVLRTFIGFDIVVRFPLVG
nr:RNA-directed DNA polymerase, eukaryota, reverse transcriptase zinc-binding domain protein [Tanacetum cinerariifolium]